MKRGLLVLAGGAIVVVLIVAGLVAAQMSNAYRWGYQRDRAVAVLVLACPLAVQPDACASWAEDTVDRNLSRTDAILACGVAGLADCLTKAGITLPTP